jgi:hypothetical protein
MARTVGQTALCLGYEARGKLFHGLALFGEGGLFGRDYTGADFGGRSFLSVLFTPEVSGFLAHFLLVVGFAFLRVPWAMVSGSISDLYYNIKE